MDWTTIERPGSFGFNRDSKFEEYNSRFGEGNWRIVHYYKGNFINFLETCKLFEQAYFIDSIRREYLWSSLRADASNVYDIDESDVNSGLDYLVQNNVANHIQDIAIRNVFSRRGWSFEGKDLIQIRGNSKKMGNKNYGRLLSPYSVRFHEPKEIAYPELHGMWRRDSVEAFYQNNKFLQVSFE